MALVLVIDDEPLMRRTLRTALERAGHRVEEAENGNEGLKKFSALRPDLILTDIVMPDREGVETIGDLRRLDPKVPIIAMSGGGSIGGTLFLRLAEELGAIATVAKPIRNTDLLKVVDECLAAPGVS